MEVEDQRKMFYFHQSSAPVYYCERKWKVKMGGGGVGEQSWEQSCYTNSELLQSL